jgi:RimJ/RimL family protein N-acetyltransferase
MKVIDLDDYVLEEFDYDNEEHINVVNEFDKDYEINKYIITTSDSFCEIIDYYRLSNNDSIYNKLYLVKDKYNNIIGEIELDGEKEDLYINYSILEMYRQNGHCTRLLIEVTKYLLNQIKTISLLIKKDNIKSMNLAKRVGYNKIDIDEYGYYKYQINS